jgi:hypothetical protein
MNEILKEIAEHFQALDEGLSTSEEIRNHIILLVDKAWRIGYDDGALAMKEETT